LGVIQRHYNSSSHNIGKIKIESMSNEISLHNQIKEVIADTSRSRGCTSVNKISARLLDKVYGFDLESGLTVE
jgi:hypothetical protein